MSRLATIAGMVALLDVSAAAYAAPPLQTQDSAPNGVIVTQGEATLTVPPDRALVRCRPRAAPEGGDAQRLAADAMTFAERAQERRRPGRRDPHDRLHPHAGERLRERAPAVSSFLARNQIEVRVDDGQAERDHRCDRDVRRGVGVRVAVRREESKHGRAGGTQAGGRRRDVARDRDRRRRINHTVGNIVRIQEQAAARAAEVEIRPSTRWR